MSQRAFITGISGFAGGFLAEHLLDAGDEVAGCSPDGRWMKSSPPSLASEVELLAWDLSADRLPDDTSNRLRDFRPEVIYHLAALSVPGACGEAEPTEVCRALNVEGTRRVLALAARLVPSPRVLLVSSSHVYARPSRPSPQVDEDSPLAPRGGYGKSKVMAERLVREAVERGADAVVVRAFQHAGPRQDAPVMLCDWARQFARGEGAVRVHSLDAWVDLSDVRDVARAYRLLVERGRKGAVYNVGSGVNRRSGEVFELMARLDGNRRPAEETSPGMKQDPIADISRLVAATGWSPRIPLEQTVAEVLVWWKSSAEARKDARHSPSV